MNARKRLTVANRGTGIEAAKENEKAIQKVVDKHIKSMQRNGWRLDHVTTGDAFFRYEAYVHMYK